MKRTALLILAAQFFCDIVCLPLGDLAAIACIPQWYAHCKATEDADMTVMDFVTDHLLDLDMLVDGHDNGDHQKPHLPFQLPVSLLSLDLFVPSQPAEPAAPAVSYAAGPSASHYVFTSAEDIFHPPVTA